MAPEPAFLRGAAVLLPRPFGLSHISSPSVPLTSKDCFQGECFFKVLSEVSAVL